MVRYFILLKSLFLDKEEKEYIKFFRNLFHKKEIKKRDNILIVIPNDYYYVCYNLLLFKNKLSRFNIYGYWPYFLHTNEKRKFKFLEKFHEIKSNLYFNLLKKKFINLYEPLSLKNTFDFDNIVLKYLDEKKIKEAKIKSHKIFKNLKNKKDILNLKINNIYCGDLIYDTYIRFRNFPTVDIKDNFLEKIIFKSVVLILAMKELQKKFKFKYLYTNYSTYIFYGIMVRVFLKEGVNVYSGKTISQYNKKLSNSDYLHVEKYKNFQKIFKKLSNKKSKLEKAKKLTNKIFFGKRKNLEFMDYMNVNPFSKSFKKFNSNVDGVVFLPNFFESQRVWGKLIFLDFYDWINFTCKIIEKNNLNIAIKPHPNIFNINTESVSVVELLQKRYPNLKWIDPFVSNLDLFKKIKFGVSPWGTVLWELPYFKINAISAGEHPACNYNLGYEPRTKKKYENLIINGHLLKRKKYSKKKIYEFCYMYFIHNLDAYKNHARKINLNQFDFSSSKSLTNFIKIIDNDKI